MKRYQGTLTLSPSPTRVAGMLIPVPGGDIGNVFYVTGGGQELSDLGFGEAYSSVVEGC